MKLKIQLLIIMALIGGTVHAQSFTDNQDSLIVGSIDIEDLIKLKKNDKQQEGLLIAFRADCQEADHISVDEYVHHYEIIVSHPSTEEFTGGAEGYKMDKQSGETNMIWHEHPMELHEMIITD